MGPVDRDPDDDRGEQGETSTTGPRLDMAPIDELDHQLLLQRVEARLLGRLPERTRIDRFLIEDKLGAGGMGTVYRAWDEQLQRTVALKFLRSGPTGSDAEQRSFREAQGLARIAHPNVVAVYDVGWHQGRVWIAMEHVPGVTLRDWARSTPCPTPSEITAHWCAAGRGLAAIHDAGLVHRDIKPTNVLRGDDGRVRVVDFGLVRTAGTTTASTSDSTRTSGSWPELTSPHEIAGTPAYAAPEQRQGRADHRSDQYALCVSLWEALCGERPSKTERTGGAVVPLPEGVRLPARLHRALSRGLALEPARRFANVGELLDALAPPRRWYRAAAAAGVAAIAGIGLGLVLGDDETRPVAPDPCANASHQIGVVWNEATRAALGERLPPPLAATANDELTRWVARWTSAAQASCEDVHVHHRLSPDSLDRRTICLDRRLSEFAALVDAAGEGHVDSPQVLRQGLSAVGSPEPCLGPAVLASQSSAPPADQRDEVDAILRMLARARLGLGLGLTDRVDDAQRSLERARAVGWAPVVGQAALVVGNLHTTRGDTDAARHHLGQALDVGHGEQDTELIADAWTGLMRIERDHAFDAQRVRWAWERRATVVDRFEDSDRQRGRLSVELGLLQRMEGRYPQAEQAFQAGVAQLARAGSGAAWEHAAALRDLGNLLSTLGRHDEALAHFEQARALELGEDSSSRGAQTLTRFNEGIAELQAGHLERARDHMRDALQIAIVEHGPRSAQVLHVHVGLAAVFDELGDLAAARDHAERARLLATVAIGSAHPFRADVLGAVGTIAVREGRAADAVRALQPALAVLEHQSPPEPLDVAMARSNLGDAWHATGDDDRAAALLERALRTMERLLAADHERLVHPLKGLGAVRLVQGDAEAARVLLARALAIHERHSGQRVEQAEVLWLLARAENGVGERARATVLAKRALAEYRLLGPAWTGTVRAIETWIANFR